MSMFGQKYILPETRPRIEEPLKQMLKAHLPTDRELSYLMHALDLPTVYVNGGVETTREFLEAWIDSLFTVAAEESSA